MVLFVIGALFILYFVMGFGEGGPIGAGGDNEGELSYPHLFIGMAICLIVFIIERIYGSRSEKATLIMEKDQIIINKNSGPLINTKIENLQIEEPEYETKYPELKLNYAEDYLYIKFQSGSDRRRFLKSLEPVR